MKRWLVILVLLVLVGGSGYVCVRWYSYIFAKTVSGRVLRVEKVNPGETIIATAGGVVPSNQIFSYALSIRSDDGEIHTASSEDRQWAVVSADQCVEAKFLKYAPWQFEKAGTYFGARLEKIFDCAKK